MRRVALGLWIANVCVSGLVSVWTFRQHDAEAARARWEFAEWDVRPLLALDGLLCLIVGTIAVTFAVAAISWRRDRAA
jgi:hypothetical protein